jgi:hypothetical protein
MDDLKSNIQVLQKRRAFRVRGAKKARFCSSPGLDSAERGPAPLQRRGPKCRNPEM